MRQIILARIWQYFTQNRTKNVRWRSCSENSTIVNYMLEMGLLTVVRDVYDFLLGFDIIIALRIVQKMLR